jgi:hypothetical protein
VAGLGFAVANTTYLIDFVGFGYGNVSASTQFGILWRNNGSDSFTPQTSWNLDTCLGSTKSGYTLAPQSINSFQIQFQYCGNILFYVENPFTGRFILVHSIPTNLVAPTIPNFQNPTLQLAWYSNSAAGSSNTLSTFGASGGHFLEGTRNFCGPRGATYNNTPTVLTLGTETMILAVKNATYYGTNLQNIVPCRSQIHLRGLTVSAAGFGDFIIANKDNYFSPAPAIVNFRQIRNPIAGGPSVWSPYNGTNGTGTDGSNIYGQSTLSSNTAALTGITGGSTGFSVVIPCGSSQFIDLANFESVAYPGDVLCFTANANSQLSLSNVTVAISLTWNEDL